MESWVSVGSVNNDSIPRYAIWESDEMIASTNIIVGMAKHIISYHSHFYHGDN